MTNYMVNDHIKYIDYMKSIIKLTIASLLTIICYTDIFAQTPIPVCPQSASFTGMTRGYYFTAPTSFTICGIFVEDDMSTAFQSAAIVRFTAGTPPAYPGTTNSFVTLWQNLNYVPNNMIPVPNVTINAGDIIGIYGSRTANSVNSYGPAQCVINIQGNPTTTFRSGMQFDLAAGPGMHDIWNENNGSIGRVTMYTNCCPSPAAIPNIAGTDTVCEGDSVSYTIPAQTGALNYNWVVPPGATITGGQGTTSLNVAWNTAPGGQICVDWTDTCTTSPQTCINVTVNPTPTANVPANATYCNGDPVPPSVFTSLPVGGTFDWTNSDPSIGLAASGSGDTPPFNATNNSSNPITATITVTPTLAGCSGLPVTYTITINPTPQAPTAANITICPDDTAFLNATAPGGTYSWYDSATGGNLLTTGASYTITNLNSDTTYYLETTVNGCISPRSPITVTISPDVTVNILASSTYLFLGESSNLTAYSGIPNTSYSWNPPAGLSCIFCSNPIATPNQSGWYYVTATNASGCKAIDSIYIEVDPTANIYVPNIFSPNENGNNDVYKIRGKGVDLFYLAIYNRWGQLVFESNDIDQGWDGTKNGKMLNQGVFVYKLNVTMKSGEEYKQSGNITLVR